MDIRSLAPLALLLALPTVAHAGINRCADGNGVFVYTDKPCSALHAVERAPPIETQEEKAKRVAQSVAQSAPQASTGRNPSLIDQRSVRASVADGARLGSVGIGCPAYSRQALADATRRAFASGDANQLSGLTDWKGTSRGSADRMLSRYKYLVKHPVATVSVDSVDAATLDPTAQLALPPADPDAPMSDVFTPPVEAIRVEFANSAGGDASLNQYFRFSSSGRCYWLKP